MMIRATTSGDRQPIEIKYGSTRDCVYLYELRRTTQPGTVVVDALSEEIGLARCDLWFPQVIAAALGNDWTRDPFDRIVVAQAQVRRTPLLTRDAGIREHYAEAVWIE